MEHVIEHRGLRLVIGDQSHLDWAADRLGGIRWPADSCSLAILGPDADPIRAVVVYNYFTETSCCAHIATNGRKDWATRGMLYGIFALPFLHNRLNRVTLPIADDNKDAQILALKLGFGFEGRLRAGPQGADEILFGMLRENCIWIGDDHG